LGADEGLESVPDGGFGARLEVARCTHRLAMGEMAASIAHEINQPLAAIAVISTHWTFDSAKITNQ